MQNKLVLAAIALCLLGAAACNCPPDEQVGTLNLGPEARAFLPYTGQETLTLVAGDGDTRSLTAPRGEEVGADPLCTRVTCTEARLGSPSSCEFVAAESRRYTFFTADNSMVLDVLLYSGQNERNSTDWFDALQVSISSGTGSAVGGHIIAQRFNGDLKTNELGISRFFQSRDSLTLNGRTFEDVLALEDGNLAIYVQPGVGVVGVRAQGKTWLVTP